MAIALPVGPLPGMLPVAGNLFEVAKAAYGRTKDAPSDRAAGHVADALTAIVFSAVALEAFINEAGRFAALPPVPGETIPGSVSAFAALAEEIEESRGPLNLKFLLAKHFFTGQPYDKGVPPYQDFDLLIRLRNALVHPKPEEKFEFDAERRLLVATPHSLVARLRSKNILAEFEPDIPASLISWLGTRAVARWACNAASEMVRSIIDAAPESRFKEALIFFYARFFGSVETERG